MRNRFILALISFIVLFAIGFASISSGAKANDVTLSYLNVMLDAAEVWLEDEPLVVLQHVGVYAAFDSREDFKQQFENILTEYAAKKGISNPYDGLTVDSMFSEKQEAIQYQISLRGDQDTKLSLSFIGSLSPSSGSEETREAEGEMGDSAPRKGTSMLFVRIEGLDKATVMVEKEYWQTILDQQESKSKHRYQIVDRPIRPSESWHILVRGTILEVAQQEMHHFQQKLSQALQATLLDEYADASTVSLSLNSKKLGQGMSERWIHSAGAMNLQIMLHRHTTTGQEELIMGYPAISSLN